MELKGKRVLVVGLGESGLGMAKWLHRQGAVVRVADSRDNPPNLEALREHAHSLKSASANLGAMQLSAAAKRVELGARTGSLDRPAVEVARIAWEFQRARELLLDALPRAEAS